MKHSDLQRVIEHVTKSIETSPEFREPFYHLQLAKVFPDDIYAKMLQAMPIKDDYRPMSGRTKYTRTGNGGGTRVKLDLFPEFVRHLPAEKREVWSIIGRTLCSRPVREAFRKRLAPGLEIRFGSKYRSVGMYPIPILTRDVAGYKIGVHPDTKWKGMTIQLYLPPDETIKHVGTVFHKRTGEKSYSRESQMSFSPNTGYAFAVDKHTYHSVDTVGPEVSTRDSILLTYFVDNTPLHILRNRSRRVGNFILNEVRSLKRN